MTRQAKYIIIMVMIKFVFYKVVYVFCMFFLQWWRWVWCKDWCVISAGHIYQLPLHLVLIWQRVVFKNVLLRALTAQSMSLRQWWCTIVPKNVKNEVSLKVLLKSFKSMLSCSLKLTLYLSKNFRDLVIEFWMVYVFKIFL